MHLARPEVKHLTWVDDGCHASGPEGQLPKPRTGFSICTLNGL